MSTNYKSLLNSEKLLKKHILNYVIFCEEVHAKLWSKLDNKIPTDDIIDSIERKIKISENIERDLIDECIWIISKETPRANHLRKIVSIIYQTKDIERAINYALSIIKSILRNKLEIEDLNIIKDVVNKYLELIKSFAKLYKNDKEEEKYEISEKWANQFYELSYEVNKKIKKSVKIENYIGINLILKNIESTLERVKSIFAIVNFESKA